MKQSMKSIKVYVHLRIRSSHFTSHSWLHCPWKTPTSLSLLIFRIFLLFLFQMKGRSRKDNRVRRRADHLELGYLIFDLSRVGQLFFLDQIFEISLSAPFSCENKQRLRFLSAFSCPVSPIENMKEIFLL